MTEQDPRLVEPPVRFSLSKLWQIQRNYFATMGINAWKEEVPFYISSNTFIAHNYALLLINFIKDWRNQNPENHEPFYIVELGSGTGKFSFYFLQTFKKLLSQNNLTDQKFCYIISDLIENNITYCKENSSFQPYIERGEVDFSCFNVEENNDYFLQLRNVSFSKLKISTPLLIIANYTFDCIKQDAFEIRDNKFYETQLGIRSRYKNFNLEKSQHLKELRFDYQEREIDINDYYENPKLNEILKKYSHEFKDTDTIIMMPVGALQFIDNMTDLTCGNFFMITGDKGISQESKIPFLRKEQRMTYDGCYSCSVNFHAMGEYQSQLGGDYLFTANGNEFKVNLFSIGRKFSDLPQTTYYFETILETTGPSEYCYLYVDVDSCAYRFSLRGIISFLRYSQWDPNAYSIVHDRLMELIDSAEMQFLIDIFRDLEKIKDNVYRMNIGEDIYNMLGLIYEKVDEEETALALYEKSFSIFEKSSESHCNSAKIYERQKNIPKALFHYQKSYELNSKNTFAKRKILLLTGRPVLASIVPILRGIFLTLLFGALFYLIIKQ